VVGKASPWIELDSPCAGTRLASERAWKAEMAWASHLGVPAVMAPPPRLPVANYAMHANQTVQASGAVHLWVRVPLTYPEVALRSAAAASSGAGAAADGSAPTPSATAAGPASASAAVSAADPWEAWNALRAMTESHPHVSVVLEVTDALPEQAALDVWLAEPVKAAILPTSIFMANAKGYPTLAKRHREFVQALHVHNVQFLLVGRPAPLQGAAAAAAAAGGGGAAPEASYRPYLQYITYLLRQASPFTEKDGFESPYYDVLQAPLQPLMDNLESQTYETFERDPVKYDQYEAAAAAALADRPASIVTVVMVVGAGRGPLVRRVLAASDATGRPVRVYAVEKNPNAVIT
jgi:protein arginine N-methyltransferase 5